MKLRELLKALPDGNIPGTENPEITALASDSRRVRPGGLYVALRGEKDDGHRYIAQALERGARAVLVEKPVETAGRAACVVVKNTRAALPGLAAAFHGHPGRKIGIAGVTGTNGKTTTTYFLESVLEAAGRPAGVIGTINYRMGGRQVPSTNTTPGALEIQEMLAEMVEAGCRWAVMEVSSHALAQGRVENLPFDAALLTNTASHEHLDYHRTFRAYLECKKTLFTRCLPSSDKERKFAVINRDDRLASSLLRHPAPGVETITFGFRRGAMIRGWKTETTARGLRLEFSLPGSPRAAVELLLPGRYNAANALAAAGFGHGLGLDRETIIEGLSRLKTVPGRFEEVETGRDFRVVVDYAHTESGLLNLLLTAREVLAAGGRPGRLLLAFGCGGDRDPGKRPKMGRLAARLADYTVLTSDNPRSENPEEIIRQIAAGMGRRKPDRVLPDRREAIAHLVGEAAPGDLVLVAGKGHETYQVTGNTTAHFDDRQEARRALEGKKA